MKHTLTMICSVVLFSVICSCLGNIEGTNMADENNYNELIWNYDYLIEFNMFDYSTLEKSSNKGREIIIKDASLEKISDYIDNNHIRGKLLIVTIGKTTHMDLDQTTLLDIAKTINRYFKNNFDRVIVKRSLSSRYHGVIFDSRK